MSTLSPSPLVSVVASTTFRQGVEDNFEKLVDRSWKVTANEVSGTPTTAMGAPTTGAHVTNELWRDLNGAEFRCTSGGTPGSWVQFRPAIVGAEPVGAPAGYWIVRTDQNFASYYESGGSYLPIGGSLTGAITPTTLAANTDNWAPTGFSSALIVRVAASAAVELRGLTGGTAGKTVYVHNIGAENVTLMNQAGTSTAANRFDLPLDFILEPSAVIVLQYDTTSSRWRVLGGGIPSDFGGGEVFNFVAKERTITANTDMAGTDNGLWINVDSVGSVIVTVDSADALPTGWSASFYQKGAGSIVFAAAGTYQIVNWQGASQTAGSYAVATLKRIGASADFVLSGNVT